MHRVELSKIINRITSLFYKAGIWHRSDDIATVKETGTKLFLSFYYLLFPLSLACGALITDDPDDSIFLTQAALMCSILAVKASFIIWKKKEILGMLNRYCVFSVEEYEDFNSVNITLSKFERLATAIMMLIMANAVVVAATPFFMGTRTLFYNIAFPLDWKNNEIAFWIAHSFIVSHLFLYIMSLLFLVIIPYLFLNCDLKYKILGNRIAALGAKTIPEKAQNKRKFSIKQMENIFFQDLNAVIDSYQQIREQVNQLESFTSNLFFLQILTSSACICGSIYCLAFNVGESLFQYFYHVSSLVYNTTDIFVFTYLGNEIILSSNRLSYYLFESNWIDQPGATRKTVIIFGEILKQPQEMIIGKLYPLSLATFTRILNSAYSMFNILQNLK